MGSPIVTRVLPCRGRALPPVPASDAVTLRQSPIFTLRMTTGRIDSPHGRRCWPPSSSNGDNGGGPLQAMGNHLIGLLPLASVASCSVRPPVSLVRLPFL